MGIQMGRQKKKPSKKKPSGRATSQHVKHNPAPFQPTDESREAEAVTVAWMLSFLATIAAQFAGFVAWVVLVLNENPNEPAPAAAFLPGLLLVSAIVTGTICLILTPFVYKMRKQKPPRLITFTVVLVGLMGYATAMLISLNS